MKIDINTTNYSLQILELVDAALVVFITVFTSLLITKHYFQHSHHHWLCTFASDEQEPACRARKNLHQWRLPCFTVCTTASLLGKCYPRSPSFIGPNRWKSESAKSRLYSGVWYDSPVSLISCRLCTLTNLVSFMKLANS